MQRTHYISAASLYGIPGVDKNSALVDTGASACFVNHEWIKQQKYTTFKVSKPIRLALADGEEVAKLTHAADITIKHGNHISTVLCYVTSLGKYDVILGMNWLDRHKPILGFGSSRSMTFDHKDCKVNCLKDGIQDTVYEDRPPESASRKLSQESTPAGDLKISMISAEAACMAAAKEPETVVWLEPHHFDKIKQPKDPSHDDCDLSAFRDQVAGLASVDPALRVATLTSHQGPDTKHAVFLACCHLQRARLTVLDVAQRMYSDSEMDSVLETCALDALHLAPVANEEPQGLGGENDVAPDDAGDLTDRISAAYPQDALLQAIIKAKKDGLRRLPANIVGSDRKLRLELGDCALYNDLLYVRGKLYVPDFNDVRTKPLDDEGHVELADPEVDDDTEYTVEAVLDSRINKQFRDPELNRKGLLQYKVRWADYPEGPDNPSWEPYMNLVGSADLVIEYHRQKPAKPGPHRKFNTLAGRQDLLMLTIHSRTKC
ncbi:Asp-protease-2 multi-domain protein [Pyrenophora teres f. maculata]|nr:Asp-protease-2 multi-domain protein [Pyrenophora teres f. maculata]